MIFGIVTIIVGAAAIAEILITPGTQYLALIVSGVVLGFGINQVLNVLGLLCPRESDRLRENPTKKERNDV